MSASILECCCDPPKLRSQTSAMCLEQGSLCGVEVCGSWQVPEEHVTAVILYILAVFMTELCQNIL
jgi:hypothetical protein